MTNQPDHYGALIERMARIHDLIVCADTAKRLPAKRRGVAERVSLDNYSRDSEPVKAAFNKIRDRFAADEQRHGEIARDRELKRLAVELDKARDGLAALAQAASFDLLDLAREWRT